MLSDAGEKNCRLNRCCEDEQTVGMRRSRGYRFAQVSGLQNKIEL